MISTTHRIYYHCDNHPGRHARYTNRARRDEVILADSSRPSDLCAECFRRMFGGRITGATRRMLGWRTIAEYNAARMLTATERASFPEPTEGA